MTVLFRGRELVHPEIGSKVLMSLTEQVKDLGLAQGKRVLDGRRMSITLMPRKNA